MGYRSEVAWGVRLSTPKDEETVKQLKSNEINLDEVWKLFLSEVKLECSEAFKDLDIQVNYKSRCLWFRDGGLKWYSEYEGVKAHERILDIADEYNQRYDKDYNLPELFDIAFVRIGEEEGDIESRYAGEGYDLFYPVSIIEGELMSDGVLKGESL